MVKTILIKEVGINDKQLIENFLLEPESVKTFRYFENRPIDVVTNHIITYSHFSTINCGVWSFRQRI